MNGSALRSQTVRIVNVVGARPNFMKIAPLMNAYAKCERIEPILVHTGQHYDEKMSDLFFRELEIPTPHLNLEVGSGSHAVQTAQTMIAFEKALLSVQPRAVLVVGDVNSTIACGLVAVKMGIILIHVEAGLRSFDRTMPEEINRVLTDSISDLLFCSEESAVVNLKREGVSPEKLYLVGNVMIDTLRHHREKAESSTILETLGLKKQSYVTMTLHRPSNVDDPQALAEILTAVKVIQHAVPVIFPCHPRTKLCLKKISDTAELQKLPNLHITEPLGYLDFLKLMAHSRVVITDSGGVQEETTVLQVPCLTLRENTERPVTIELGSSRLVGASASRILAGYRDFMANSSIKYQIPPLWDGRAADRIVTVLNETLHN
jgi:UDP-N-acetylglucosamine 2-epimerase (non-hydrolysing)